MNKPILLWGTLMLSVLLTGCSTSKEDMLPAGDNDMMAVWSGKTTANTGSRAGQEAARATLRRTLTDSENHHRQTMNDDYTRTQSSEIHQQFPRLPNPDMVMYVFPHLSSGNLPVPGYSTVFPFYHQVQYALPGERVEDL
ncbi:TIGR03751 family conjugal transfer lipoprotein [Providencia rettgeri]|uniref:TIGR03751 family conjugal transfer lipoprotein n=1 Tax=Providencia rettgeri TaxID=587 RepID=UPI00301B5117